MEIHQVRTCVYSLNQAEINLMQGKGKTNGRKPTRWTLHGGCYPNFVIARNGKLAFHVITTCGLLVDDKVSPKRQYAISISEANPMFIVRSYYK